MGIRCWKMSRGSVGAGGERRQRHDNLLKGLHVRQGFQNVLFALGGTM
jgi:hypothetical protein